ncbi:MAG: DUF423 domain-containing protein [Xanthomonadales bacterium]|nr:DUF423 domain-containing protein [Xanthomonadales bacterium]
MAAGAFGAHALKGRLDTDALALWKTAVDYQFWHALGLLALAMMRGPRSALATLAASLLLAGIALFSGSLYALALGAPRLVGVLTPFGGVALIAGWLCLAIALWRKAMD